MICFEARNDIPDDGILEIKTGFQRKACGLVPRAFQPSMHLPIESNQNGKQLLSFPLQKTI
jgi:hypothetical protein